MVFHVQQAVRALILLSFSILIFKMHYFGDITKFVNPKYIGLSQTASVIFLILFFIQITRIWSTKKEQSHCHDHSCTHHHDHGGSPLNPKKTISYLVIAIPIFTGFLLPAKVLDASIADKKGGLAALTNQMPQENEAPNNGNSGSSEKQADTNNTELEQSIEENSNPEVIFDDTVDPNLANQPIMSNDEYKQYKEKLSQSSNVVMEDAVFSTYYENIHENLENYKGKQIQLKGFVYKEDGLYQNQLVISRFMISHCVADASIAGFISQFSEATISLENDTWIEATGVIDITVYDGIELPIINITNWKKIEQPEQPYIYPITIRLM